jgi:hypothetical protein
MKKFLKIRDSSRFITFKNRKVRTPVTIEIADKDLKQLSIILKMADIQNYEVILEEEIKKKEEISVIEENKQIVIEELESKEPSTLLEEFMRTGEDK